MKLKLILAILLIPFLSMGATNQFGDIIVFRTTTTSNLTSNIRIGINTNAASITGVNSDALVARNPPGASSTYFTLQDDGTSPAAGFQFGNLNGNYHIIDADGNNPPNLRVQMNGVTLGNMNFRDNTQNFLVLNPGSSINTYGNGASWAHTFNGSTYTLSHHATINAGVFVLPTSVAGNSTNGTVKSVNLGSSQATNFIVSGVTGTLTFDAGTNAFIIRTSDGIFKQGGFFSRTNTATGSMAIDLWYTNGTSQLNVNAGVRLPGTTTTAAAVQFQWQITGITNSMRPVSSSMTAGAVITNWTGGIVPPSGLYRVNSIGSETPTIILPAYLEHN